MIGMNAGRIISIGAIMESIFTYREWPFMKFIGKMVSRYFFTIYSQTSISKSFSSNPKPTSRSFFNIIPKASYGVFPTFTTETTEARSRFTALLTDKIDRIFTHLKVSPLGVTPLDAKTSQGLFTGLIIPQGACHG
jgi:hypothetical protein